MPYKRGEKTVPSLGLDALNDSPQGGIVGKRVLFPDIHLQAHVLQPLLPSALDIASTWETIK
jgi:hypothetical protein